MKRSFVAARRGAVALIATALSVALQRTDPSPYELLVALSLLALAATGIWLLPGGAPGRWVSLAMSAPLLLIALANSGAAIQSPRTVAVAAGPLFFVLAAATLMRDSRAIVVGVAGGVLAGPLRMLVYDPFLDPSCGGCGHADVAIWPHPTLAGQMRVVGLGVSLAALVWELLRGRVVLTHVALSLAAYFLDVSQRSAVVVTGGYIAMVWALRFWLTWRRRTAVSRLLAAHVGENGLTATLRRATRDPTLLISFPTADGTESVDAEGERVVPAFGQASTDLFVHGELLARVHHSATAEVPDLDDALDPLMSLVLQKERLTAQLAARVQELTRARTLVVRVGLEQRRTLERDLHDGVQQQLLAAGLHVRLALDSLPDDSAERPALQEALALVWDAVEQVRIISTGVSPPMLATRGLAVSVAALVRRHANPVHLDELPERRLSPDVERAAYAVVAEGLARGATSVRATMAGNELTVVAEGTLGGLDGVLPDLIAALGGKICVGTSTIEAVIPCA